MNKKRRVFIAINLPDNIKKQISSYKNKWQELPAKCIDFDNIHITLEFLGNITSEELGKVCMAIKEIAEKHSSFDIIFKKVVYGPPKKVPPRMIWVQGESSKELSFLKNDLNL